MYEGLCCRVTRTHQALSGPQYPLWQVSRPGTRQKKALELRLTGVSESCFVDA